MADQPSILDYNNALTQYKKTGDITPVNNAISSINSIQGNQAYNAPYSSTGQSTTPKATSSNVDPHINPATGVWDDNYFASHNTSTPSSQAPGNQSTDYNSILQNAISASKAAVQPQIDALSASKQPLQDRYTALLNTIKNNQGIAENRQTTATNNELGARGLLPGSTLSQQTLANALNPITYDYTNQAATTNAQESSDLSSIDQAIASLTGGALSGANSNAANIYGAGLNYNVGQGQVANQAASNALQNLILQNVTIPQSQASINSSNANAGLAAANTGLANAQNPNNPAFQSILQSLGLGGNTLGSQVNGGSRPSLSSFGS